jgi:hypothetical protein
MVTSSSGRYSHNSTLFYFHSCCGERCYTAERGVRVRSTASHHDDRRLPSLLPKNLTPASRSTSALASAADTSLGPQL